MTRPRLVQKLGGTSLGTPELILAAAERAVAARRAGMDVALVVSAMAGETDRLLALVRRVSPTAAARELDVVAATGEQVSAGLMAAALRARGASARALLAHQLPIRTDGVFGDAQIISLAPSLLEASFAAGEIPVVAGFQGIDASGAVTTLGRGGSDTTAVAVAAALGATCEIYTDVDGVYSIDPRICDRAVRLPFVGYHTMHALAAAGAKVLETRSVALAMAGGVSLHVRSSFQDGRGTFVVEDGDPRAHAAISVAVRASGATRAEARVVGATAHHFPIESVELRLARAGIAPFSSSASPDGYAFVVSAAETEIAARALHAMFVLDLERTSSAHRVRAPRHDDAGAFVGRT